VDARANRLFKQRVRALAKCFPNVLVNDVEYRLDSMVREKLKKNR
jgi:hypothetical protein